MADLLTLREKTSINIASLTDSRVSNEYQDFDSCTGFSSEIGTKLRELAVGQAGGSCYSRAALSSNDSKTLYKVGTIPK